MDNEDLDTNAPTPPSFTAVNAIASSGYSPLTNLLLHDADDQHSPITEDCAVSKASSDGFDFSEYTNDLLDRDWRSRSPDDSENLRPGLTTDTNQPIPQVRYSYDNICNEALEYYESAVPPFCIRDKGAKTKMVEEISTGRKEYTKSGQGTKYIVKHNAGQFYAWEGTNDKLATEPVVKVIRPNKLSTPKRPGLSSIKPITPTSDHQSDDSTSTIGFQTRFRKRTARQERPFEIDKIEHNLAKKGVAVDEADLADQLQSRSARKKVRKASVASVSDADDSPQSKTTLEVYNELSIERAKIRIWFSKFASASIPIALEILTANNMFSLVSKAWEFKLNGDEVKYAVASFPWLKEDSNILFVRDNNNDTAFEVMFEQIRKSPTWNDSESCTFDLQIHV